ncbi:hypothetical protein [Paenibacillus sp. HJGM_3]|uniref:hypothetical protein n=1 Tax=Paenibacillus sp. HJGM_3 TaxID=3379816 RepID=UPI00385CE92F
MLYKSLLSTEELNELLSPEQVSELAAADRQPRELHAPASEEAQKRIRQLELDILNLLQRVELLEYRLSVLAGQTEAEPAALQETAASGEPVQAASEPATPLILSRVEKYKQQKPKKSFFR